jgi:hypothetical protein
MLPQAAWRRTHVAYHKAVPDDHCIAELFAPSSARGMAGAESGKRNIPGTACLRLVQAHVIITGEAPTAKIEPVLEIQHTRVSQGVAPCLARLTADGPERKSGMATCSASPGGHALVIQTLRLQPHDWLSALHCLPAPAPTCCAPIRDVGPVEEPSQRQGDISCCSCSAGPSQRELSFARFACTLQYPRLLAFVMMAFTSRQHAPEMNCGPAASLLGGTGSARQPCARICALPYPLIDCDTYPTPQPSHRGLSHV